MTNAFALKINGRVRRGRAEADKAQHDGQTRQERQAHREWLAWCDGRHAAEMGNGNPYRRGSKQHAAWERGAHHTVALHVLAFITDLYR
jgi:hypothetical protein